MQKYKLIKNTNDFIIGVALLILGLYVIFSGQIVRGAIPSHLPGGFLTRPDVYVRLIGCFLTFCSALLVLKSFNFTRTTKIQKFKFRLSKEIIFTVLALIFYAFFLTRIGFFASTFILVFFLTYIYRRKEKSNMKELQVGKKTHAKDLITVFSYSCLLVLAVYVIFTRILFVALP
jgi:hypothetical protein